MFGGRVYQQTVGIPMGTNCAPLLADLFLYSYEAYFIQELLKKDEKKLAQSFNYKFQSLSNSKLGDFIDRIYPIELEIKKTTDKDGSASYLDLHLELNNEDRQRTKLYGQRDDQLIRYSIAYGSYHDFLYRRMLLTINFLNQDFLVVNLKSSLRTFYGRHHDFVNR